ncbi:ABC transporter substrate-binding protein [Betaproteobacteria bacterium]|nr:ABC transporter substrate-binding protein [Betaproteobacteria bacterium]GHU46185.1 ABC transporter substrate-binding protein [Betaproteobacteria bacterium]
MKQNINFKRRQLASLLLAGAAGGWSGALFAQSHVHGTPAVASNSADANRVIVLTSYPEELSARFQKAFEQRYPGKRVEILWRHSADALAYLRRGGDHEVDVYWTPAPRNFATLKAEGRLAKLALDTEALPTTLAGFPISDPDGYFAAFELAGYGIAYNPTAVQKLGLPAPKDWRDLTHPAYYGQVQLPIPGRVGFAPVLIEAVLQGYGWTTGWAVLAAIASNANFNSGDRTPDTDDVVSGRKAARMTIDFFAPPNQRNANPTADAPLAFVYPPKTAWNPSQVAIFAAAPHPTLAKTFVDFVLSAEGQELLLEPDVRRLPVRKDLYAKHPDLSAQPFAPGNLAYSDAISRARQGLVATLFDVALVEPHQTAAPLWRALHRAEQGNPGKAADHREARALLSAIPVTDLAQQDATLRRLFDFPDRIPNQPEPPPAAERLAMEAAWKADVALRLDKAKQLLQGV